MRTRVRFALGLTVLAGLLGLAASVLLWSPPLAHAAGDAAAAAPGRSGFEWGLIGAALATGLSSLGAGYAVATVGGAAIGAITEKPEMFGRFLIVIGLAEGIAIYGLIVSILILNTLAR